MAIYYKKETLFVEVESSLEEKDYKEFKKRLFRIIEDYGVDRVEVLDIENTFQSRNYLRDMKKTYYARYQGDFRIR